MSESPRLTADLDDERVTAYLAAYDEALASGKEPPAFPDGPWPAELRERWQGVQDTLHLLEIERLQSQQDRDVPPAAAPTHLGRFRLIRTLGAGGFGIVYLADDPLLGRQVALKVPRPEALITAELRERFLREARLAGRLSHAHIVPIYDSGAVGPFCFLVSAYYAGGTLAEWLAARDAPAPIRTAVDLTICLADAVQHAHERGVLHRDLKPNNVILEPVDGDPTGLGFLPRITDFGLAKLLDAFAAENDNEPNADALTLTRSHAFLGTPAYMAPEQAHNRREQIGPATDVFALGAMLFEFLTGRVPFQAATSLDALLLTIHGEPPRPSRLRPTIPSDLEAICLKCLEKQPNHRYASAAELADDLRRFQSGLPTRARPISAVARFARWTRRRPLAASFVAVVGLALLSLGLGIVWHGSTLREYDEALAEAALREQAIVGRAERDRMARRQVYSAGVALIGGHWREFQPAMLRTLLEQQRPLPDQNDLRGFEWWYLWEQCRQIRHVAGNHTRVVGLAVAEDGRRGASIGSGGDLKSWDIASCRLLADQVGVGRTENTIALSVDGRRSLSSFREHGAITALELWDTESGLVAKHPILPAQRVYAAIAPDGRQVAYGSDRNHPRQVFVWDTLSGIERQVWKSADSGVNRLLFSPDSRTLALSYNGPDDPDAGPMNIELIDTASGQTKTHIRGGHRLFLFALAFAPDGQTLAAGSWDQLVILWDVRTGQEKLRLPRFQERVGSVAFSPDGNVLAVGTDPERTQEAAGQVSLWNVADGTRRRHALNPGCGVLALAYLRDGQTIAVGGQDKLVRLWMPNGSGEFIQLDGHRPAETWAVAFAPDGKSLASAGDDHQVRLWDTATLKPFAALTGHDSLVSCLAYAPDGTRLASGSYDGTVRIWDPVQRQTLVTCRGHGKPVRCVAFSPDGKTLASGGRDNTMRLWDVATGATLETIHASAKAINSLAFTPDGHVLAYGGADKFVRFWDLGRRHQTAVLSVGAGLEALAFSADGKTLVTGDNRAHLRIWDRTAAKEMADACGHRAESCLRTLAVSPDGRTIATGGDDRSVRLWHAMTGQELLRFTGLPSEVQCVAFSPDSRTLAAALHDGTIRLWQAAQVE